MGRSSLFRSVLLVAALAVFGFALLRASRAVRNASFLAASPVEAPASVAVGEESVDLAEAPLSREPEREALDGSATHPEPAASGDGLFLAGAVIERSGAPLPSALCALRRGRAASTFSDTAHESSENDAETAVHDRTSAGVDGAFRLAAGSGFWRLNVRSPGFAPWERDHLVAGEEVLVRLDPDVLVLVTVLDRAGAPVADAEVVVRARYEESASVRARVRTDPAGLAQASGLAPGPWLLVVRRSGFGVSEVPLEIPAGRFRIETEVRLERGTRLTGTVRSSAGAPIAGARVRVESPNRNASVVEEAVSGVDGRYETAPLFAVRETLEVLATAEGFAESSLFYAVDEAQARAGGAALDFVLESSVRTLVGRAVDAGEGVPGASVRIASIDPVGTGPDDVIIALQAAPMRTWAWQEVARTDGEGRFEVGGLSRTPQYILLIVHEPHAPRVAWVPPGEPGSVTDLGDLALARCGSLFGRAVNADGTPADGERLALTEVHEVRITSPAELGAFRPSSWFKAVETLTAEDGRFRFDGLDPGIYQLHGTGTEWQIEPERAIGPVEVVLARTRPTAEEVTLSGTVRDRAGQPIASVFVRGFTADGSSAEMRLHSNQLADANGAFSIRVPAAGASRIHFADLTGVFLEHELFLQPPLGTEALAVVLDARTVPLPSLEGSVFSPRGEGVEGAGMTLRPPEDSLCGCLAFHTRTDAAGEFRFRVSEGPHRLTASHPRYSTATHYPARPGQYVVIDLQDP